MRIRGLMHATLLPCGLLAFAVEAAAISNQMYEGGPVIRVARAVDIFWGPSFSDPTSPDYQYARILIAYRNQLGMTREYNVITQYYQIVNGVKQFIELTNLGAGTPDWFDSSTPPHDVTDADVQAEVQRYLATHAADASTIYEVFLPTTSYSSFEGETSCGGPAVGYCAYHSTLTPTLSPLVKYAVQPYPSCGGCQVSGWSAVENQEHFVAYTTRATAVNPTFNSWYNSMGLDGDSICLWTPPPFLDNGAYPYEWSNLASGCVKWR
jgi:hypothetical protein